MPPPRGLMGIFIGAFRIWAPSRLSSRVTGRHRTGRHRALPAYTGRRPPGSDTSRQLGGLRAPDAARSGAALWPRCPRGDPTEPTARNAKPLIALPLSRARHPLPAGRASPLGVTADTTDLPAGWTGDVQLTFLLAVYSYILFIGCGQISEGSELLALTPCVDAAAAADARARREPLLQPRTPAEEGRAPRFAAGTPGGGALRASRHASHAARRARRLHFVRARAANRPPARAFLARRYAKLVGSCVLPVLGAVPDGAIVLFSGIGPQAQTQLDVGVGALAGSTVMLLTIPWILSIIGGRVPIVNGEVRYNQKKNMPPHEGLGVASGVSRRATRAASR